MEALLQLKGIDKAFPGVKALSGAALNVYPGRVMALVGENGAGKSTMMKVLTGIYARDAGTLLWLGKETTFTGPKSSQEAGIGIIHQELNLIPQLTIAENIFLGREFVNRFGKIDWKTMYAEADKLLAKLNLRFKSDKLVGDLSIGDQQMVEIAKVLSFESKVIIMDEPTDALTDTAKEMQLPYQLEIMPESTGTDADALALAPNGARAGTVSIPLRYMHTPVEVIDIRDVELTAQLLAAYAGRCGR